MSEKSITGLTPDNTIKEYFEFFKGADEAAVQVVPTCIDDDGEIAQYAIFIKGQSQTASYIMGQLMQTVNDLFDSQQQEAAAADDSRIITS